MDVDLSARLITIRRSHDRDTTEDNHADAIPIANELVPCLRNAIERLAINPAEAEAETGKVAAFAAPSLQPSGDHEISARREFEKAPVFGDLEGSGIPGSNRRHSGWEATRAA